jgi:hypothetical protein
LLPCQHGALEEAPVSMGMMAIGGGRKKGNMLAT